ncbi:MAG: galactokinase [Spirochaetaceae bacterium]|jgi:galactokinase|nr:galactokinase [Spirochaetaceae bacterium]
MTAKALFECLASPRASAVLGNLYGPEGVEDARRRYGSLVEGLGKIPGDFPGRDFSELSGDIRLFTAPGRTELGGNHTDHNQGKVLAASIHLDQAAAAVRRKDKTVIFRSTGYPDVVVDLTDPSGSPDLAPKPEETGATEALIRGIAAEFAARGTAVGGFTANAASTVLTGSGLSSSAAVEVLLGRIFDNLYGEGKRSFLEIAQIGQRAENNYFGKPSGLMDQTACASGGVVAIDFADAGVPAVNRINLDLSETGYVLCVADTRGSHADLTPDYAAVPEEMRAVARFFGKPVLREVDEEMVYARMAELRKAVGDRAVLRAVHFFDENRRVEAMVEAVKKMGGSLYPEEKKQAMGTFLDLVNASGNSSLTLLQNIYSTHKPREQGVSLALFLSGRFFGNKGACRVHGGGFAGTIQAYLPRILFPAYKAHLEAVFGAGSVTPLRIRPAGAEELVF